LNNAKTPRRWETCHHFKTEDKNTPKIKLIDNLKAYSEENGRNVVIYASNFLNNDSEENYINSFDKTGFMKVMKNLDKSKGLDLILHTQRVQWKFYWMDGKYFRKGFKLFWNKKFQ